MNNITLPYVVHSRGQFLELVCFSQFRSSVVVVVACISEFLLLLYACYADHVFKRKYSKSAILSRKNEAMVHSCQLACF